MGRPQGGSGPFVLRFRCLSARSSRGAVYWTVVRGHGCEVRLGASGIYRRLPRTRAPVCARGGGRCRMLSVYNELAGLQDIWDLALLLWDGLQVTRQFPGSLHSNATDLRCSARCMVL